MPTIPDGTTVKIKGTQSFMDGQYATVIGIVSEHVDVSFYILKPLTFKLENGYSAFQLISSCFEIGK